MLVDIDAESEAAATEHVVAALRGWRNQSHHVHPAWPAKDGDGT